MKQDAIRHVFPDTSIDKVLKHTFFNDDFQIRFLQQRKEVSTVSISKGWNSNLDKDDPRVKETFMRETSVVVDKINAPAILGIKRVDLQVTESLVMESRDKCRVICDICLVGESPMKEFFEISAIFDFAQKSNDDNFQSVELTIDMKAEFKKLIWTVTDFVENALIKNENKLFCKWIEMAYDVIPCIIDSMDVEPTNVEESNKEEKKGFSLFKSKESKESKETKDTSKKSSSIAMSLKNLLKKKKKDGTQNEVEKKAQIFIKHVGYEELVKKSKEQHKEMFGVIAQKQENAYFVLFFTTVGIIIGLFLYYTFSSSSIKM
ncbi:predicted protein [Naegleria gruberi]|uniref:Predicted protein n=1 Tax=Naegleria gruberi TaxID=5762 RepID=D2VWJ7_NAEGR|nr:uncharacterized protein NAEGRDRAFT_52827 [Naegleria gruberi]EFC38905.1 predicted protein [Naegleria gruberi]|eukprot:XP_002671649.1 predicted protein [Naegleria gruberi strain NEG-M]